MTTALLPAYEEAGRLIPLATSGTADPVIATNAQPVVCAAEVLRHEWIGDRYWRMVIHAPEIATCSAPGQFAMLTAAKPGEWEPVLPRPMAIYDSSAFGGTVEFVYGVVGRGTRHLTRFALGERITVVGPLGRGFVIREGTRRILLIGRGIGACSLTALAQEAVRQGLAVVALDSARHEDALVGRGFYEGLAITLLLATDAAGSSEVSGVQVALREHFSAAPPEQVFVCGSKRLLVAAGELAQEWGASVQVSVEAHMACGLGYCHGCSSGYRTESDEAPLVCKDGPVFGWEPIAGENQVRRARG